MAGSLELFVIDVAPAIVKRRLSFKRSRFAIVIGLGQNLGRIIVVHVVPIEGGIAVAQVTGLGGHPKTGLPFGSLVVVLQGKKGILKTGS